MAGRRQNKVRRTESTLKGIIIRSFPSGDSDLVLRVITAAGGKLSILAKRARTNQHGTGARVELFARPELKVTERAGAIERFPVLKEVGPSLLFRSLREDPDRLLLASLVAESADVLVPEGDGDQPTTYQTICLGLEAIDSARDKREMLRATFLTIQALLEQGGFESSSARLPPSAHGLQRLLNRVEQCSERGLLCRKEVVNLMEGLKSSTEM